MDDMRNDFVICGADERVIMKYVGMCFPRYIAYAEGQRHATEKGVTVWIWDVSSPETNQAPVLEIQPLVVREHQKFMLNANRGMREAYVLAIINGLALCEYTMPAGTTALRYLDVAQVALAMQHPENPDCTAWGSNVSYKKVGLLWLRHMADAGTEWLGNAQRGDVGSIKDILAG